MNQSSLLINQLIALAILLVTLYFGGLGFAVMCSAIFPSWPKRYNAWVQRTISRPFNWAGRTASRQFGRLLNWLLVQPQRFLGWMLRQLWRLTRRGATALYRGLAGLL